MEIGGGFGCLTKLLANQAERVYVIEVESGLVKALKDILSEKENVTIIEGDALTERFPSVNKIVSNLPYSISSPITFRILREVRLDVAILMYQKELVSRMMAIPGSSEYSRFSIGIQYLAEVKPILEVPAAKFYPIPAVDSAVVRMHNRTQGPFAKNHDVFFWVVHGIYSYPNKLLHKALAIWCRNLGKEKTLAELIISRTKGMLTGKERLRALTQEELVVLADAVFELSREGVLPFSDGMKSAA